MVNYTIPGLVDVSEESLYAKYIDRFKIKNNLPSINLTQFKSYIQDQVKNTSHLILWFNGPDYFLNSKINPQLARCLYNNCVCTDDRKLMREASAIIFCTSCPDMGTGPPSELRVRPANQIWIFETWEPPHNHLYQDDFRHHLWKDTMNWSMTYRLDSDILLPYGHLQSQVSPPVRNYSEIFHRKTKFAAWIVSHCGSSSSRDQFVDKLRGYGINVDIYGDCGMVLEREDEERVINTTYKFYLSFENALCNDYVTEKFFHHFRQDTVLIVRGGANYDRLLPSDSFIDASKFKHIKNLADYLLKVNSSEKLYTDYLRKKDRYFVREDNLPYCDLCAKLNNKGEHERVYHDIVDYIYTDQCHRAIDVTAHTAVWGLVLFIFFCLFVAFVVLKTCSLTSKLYS